MCAHVGGLDVLRRAVESGAVEAFEVEGLPIYRYQFYTDRPVCDVRAWRPLGEVAQELGLTRRGMRYRVARGEYELRYVAGQSEVRERIEDETED